MVKFCFKQNAAKTPFIEKTKQQNMLWGLGLVSICKVKDRVDTIKLLNHYITRDRRCNMQGYRFISYI